MSAKPTIITGPDYEMGPINLKGTRDLIGLPIPECLFRANPSHNALVFGETIDDETREYLIALMPVTQKVIRYSDEELSEFKTIIEEKLAAAKKDHQYWLGRTSNKISEGAQDTAWRGGDVGEIAQQQHDKEEFTMLANRQAELIQHLKNALIRIHQKTYGICRVTGKLIDKKRLQSVPHATTSMEGKTLLEEQAKKSAGVTFKPQSSGKHSMYQPYATV